MSKIASSVITEQDKDGMLRRALERIIQLYTDKSHFVYELLQNAEDAEAKSIQFLQLPDRLEVFHDGKPFTAANLKGLCDIGRSDKADNLNQIGEFGVGFKSVFGICDTVRLYSDPSHYSGRMDEDVVPFAVEIHDFTHPVDIDEEPLPSNYTTRFVFPYTVGQSFSGFSTVPALMNTLASKLQNLGITTLLFMKHLELIEYKIDTGEEPVTGEYLLDKHVINDHCQYVSALGVSEKEKADPDAAEMISYLMFSRRLEKYPQRTVDIAFPVKEENGSYTCVKAPSPYVSVYFPTETESKLDFIVQGPYRTTPNRGSIPANDEDNIMLAKETAVLLREALLELKECGKLNLSFVKALPLSEENFKMFGLFLPLYETVRDLFRSTAIIPSKSGQYVSAKSAKIVRGEKLAAVLSDDLLTQLINDGTKHYWLSTELTENNQRYKTVYDYLLKTLRVQLLRPEDLRGYFDDNPKFLPARNNDWLVELYDIFADSSYLFNKTKFDANMMLTANIIKTSTGAFVAPFRREGKTYISNVFKPSSKIRSGDIHFVDEELYQRCRGFFDGVLGLEAPNEYEYTIKDIEKRYRDGFRGTDEQHVEDIKFLLKYVKYEDYSDEVTRIIKDVFAIKCNDGKMRNTFSARVFVPRSADGLQIEYYYRNLGQTVFFVDVEFYELHNVDIPMLSSLGVRESLITGENITVGTYETGSRGKQPDWRTSGEFRWKLSADALKEALKYITAHPTAKDTPLKSQTIMKLLVLNEQRLCGMVHIGGSTLNLENEPCEMIHILRGERMMGWNGKWIFTESGELVAPKMISKHDISVSIYGRIKADSIIFDLLGFKKTDADEVDELKKTVPQEKLEAYFESELRQRYGISSADLNERYGGSSSSETAEEEIKLPFPSLNVKNWEALKKHAAEMLIFANPVKYEDRIRSIRVSNRPREIKAYLSNMYRHEGVYKYACQMCHETCSSFESAEIFLEAEKELDPIHLCLCPNCATAYRSLRADAALMSALKNTILSKTEQDIKLDDHVSVAIDDDDELWFTQTHFAEIQELLRLTDEVKNGKTAAPAQPTADDEDEKSGLSVYSEYIGKTIRRKDGFVGKVTDVTTSGTDAYVKVLVTGGKDAGKDTSIQLSFILKNKGVYSISE